MTVGVVTVGRRKYAVGLYWENSPGGSISQAAREAARQPGQRADFYAVRARSKGGRVPQFGLAPAEEGIHVGLPAMAACLANQQPGSWAGAFRLREGTVVIIVRDDLIVPDGDLFFADESLARDRLLQEMGLGGLQRIYAPESWGVNGADTLPLGLLLNDKTDVKLQSVELSRKLIIAGGIGVFVLLGILGGGWYYQDQAAKEDAARLARKKSFEKAQAAARNMVPGVLQQQAVDYPPPERTWEKKPLGLNLVHGCKETLAKVPVTVVGWELDSVVCSGSSMTIKWKRSGGYARIPEGASLSDESNDATLSIPIANLTPRGSEELINPPEVTKRILTQNWGGTLHRAKDDPPPPPPPNFKGKWAPPPPPWVKRSFTLNAPVLPWTLSSFFADFPGLVVNTLSYSPSGVRGSWQINGVIYENRR